MHIVRASQAPRFELPGVEFTAFAAPSRGSTEVCTWLLTVAPGFDSEESHTLNHDEVFTVTEGMIRLAVGGEIVAAGDTAVVPAGEAIRLSNPGPEPASVHVAIRAGFVAAAADGNSLGTPPWAD